MEGSLPATSGRLLIGGLGMVIYLFIGACVFVRLEYPLERIERETYAEYREQWTDRLKIAGIPDMFGQYGGWLCFFACCPTPLYYRPHKMNSPTPILALCTGVFLVCLYLCGGALLFRSLELKHELEARERFLLAVLRFKQVNGVPQSEIDRLFTDIREAALNGIWMDRNESSNPNWTFGQAFFFSGTLISTVGYGRISPRTESGKLFTIIYCVIGIPLTLALLSAIVTRLKTPSHWLRGLLNRKLANLFHESQIQVFHLLAVCLMLLLFVFIVPSMIFTAIETNWTFLDSFYYCFVSLTTIGLGDFEPGDSPNMPFRGLYKIGATVYLLVGLCCMMLFLATLYDMPQLNLTRFFLASEEEQARIVSNKEAGTKYSRFEDEQRVDNPSFDNGFYNSVQPSVR